MFHLLPEKEKKVLQAEYHYHLYLVCLIFVLVTLVVASIFLFPSYLLSSRKLSDISAGNERVKAEIKAKTDPAVASFLSTLKENLASLKSAQKTPPFSVLVKEITDKKPGGISINDFQWDAAKIVMNGKADSRDDLTHFSNDLKMVTDFSNVDLPISDFAKDKDINFSITITLKNNA